MKIYFDDVLVNEESVMSLTQKGQLFDGVFKLGSTLCRTIELDIYKDVAETLNIPSVVYIYDENDTVLFTMLVDTINKDNGNYWRYNLIDKMVLLNTIYNWSGLQDKTCSNILNAICVNVLGMDASDTPTLDTFPGDYLLDFSNNIMARDLVSWIAEIEGGFARISNDGNLEIIKYKNVDEFTCDLNTCADISIGDAHVISKLKYINGDSVVETDNRYYQDGQVVVINNSNGNITSIDRYGFYVPPLYDADETDPSLKGFNRIKSVYRFIERESGDLYTGIHFGNGHQAESGFWGGRVDIDNVNLTATCTETWTLIKLTDYAIYLNNYQTRNRDIPYQNRADGVSPSLPPDLRLSKENDCYKFEIWNFDYESMKYKFENSIGDSYSNYFNLSDIKIETSFYSNMWGKRQKAIIKLYNCYERIGLDPQQDDDECSNLKNWLIDHDIKIWARYSSQDADPYFSSIPAFPLTQERIEFYGEGKNSNIYDVEYPDSKYVYVEGESLYNENNTLELNPDNLLLKDLSYNELNIIFSRIKYFEFYSFKTTRCEIDSNVYTGSIVNFVGGSVAERSEHPVIAQIDWQYNTQWIGGYDTWLDNKFQEETKIVSQTEQIKTNISVLQSEIENLDARKQDNLSAGTNISIENNVISSLNNAYALTSGTLLDAIVNNDKYNTFFKVGTSWECSDFPDGYKSNEASIQFVRQRDGTYQVRRGIAELTIFGKANITFKRRIYANAWTEDWQLYRGKLNTFAKKIFTTKAGSTSPYSWSVNAKVSGYTVVNWVVYPDYAGSRITNAEVISANDVISGYSSVAGTNIRVMVFYIASDYITLL